MDRTAADVLSGVESLASSFLPPAVSLPSCLSLPVSCSSSPLSSSRQVTARLYSSLQHSQEQEIRGHQADSHATRQVSFNVTSPLVTMTTSAPSVHSDRLNESQEVESGLSACSFSDLKISGMEEEESGGRITEEMDLNPQSSIKLLSGRRHIEEMENVRSHLQTILRARATDTSELLPSALQHLQDESDTTSQLISGVEELFPRYSRLRADFDSAPFHSVSELQLIRESLERERARRKHLEQQLLAVQNKALGLQQQLSLAVSADRKKDIMIEQLDKTLEKVVEGWRRHEKEKSEGVRRLQEEKEAAESTQQKQREALACVEKSLSEAAETLDKERKHNEELQNTNKQLECDKVELHVCVGELEQEVEHLRAEVEEKKAETERLQTQSQDLQQQLEQHKLEAKHTHTHMQQELTLLTQQLETERERVGQEVQLREEAQSRLQQLQQDLEETRRERDATRVDRALDQARFEAQRSQWEVELRLSVEQQVTERLATIQEENTNATAKLREQHRKQLLDLSARHERELSVQSDEFRAQLKGRDCRQHQLTLDFSNKMAELQKELVSMETSKRRLETQREELVARLQGMMRSHWAEALRLLTNQEQIEELLSPSSLREMTKPHSMPQTQDISICSTSHSATTAAPQAVVLQLCRDRGIRGQGDSGGDRGRVESDFSLLNQSHTFSPLEPVLDDTHLTAIGGGGGYEDLWHSPVGGERQTVNRRNDQGREQTVREREETTQSGENLTLLSTHISQDLYCDVNQSRIQSNQRINRQPFPSSNVTLTQTLNPRLKPNQAHASTDVWAKQSSDKRMGQGDVSKQMYSSTEKTAPPTEDKSLSVKMRAPPPVTNASSLCDERQNELHYYIAKLLERSPGEPLDEHQADLNKNRAETQSTNSGVSSQVELKPEQFTDLPHLTLPSTHTPQQLQQHPDNLMRSGEMFADQVRANLNVRIAQNNRREQRQSATHSTQITATRGRRAGPQGQRSGSKVNAWR
ncbi:centrobin isoform X1 [Hemibagrus wyckioides]|uniref:centrobin isoform X1 n=1 Tax=Hemibagrus wyckioides TaxID=337641 RepID=UPI00266CC6EC|nr:centrobin isoform X1 [Hemibagrus wyckioides]XP_058266900.1 centrobin isoform X1 [Hemibagrus wyckioides]